MHSRRKAAKIAGRERPHRRSLKRLAPSGCATATGPPGAVAKAAPDGPPDASAPRLGQAGRATRPGRGAAVTDKGGHGNVVSGTASEAGFAPAAARANDARRARHSLTPERAAGVVESARIVARGS